MIFVTLNLKLLSGTSWYHKNQPLFIVFNCKSNVFSISRKEKGPFFPCEVPSFQRGVHKTFSSCFVKRWFKITKVNERNCSTGHFTKKKRIRLDVKTLAALASTGLICRRGKICVIMSANRRPQTDDTEFAAEGL